MTSKSCQKYFLTENVSMEFLSLQPCSTPGINTIKLFLPIIELPQNHGMILIHCVRCLVSCPVDILAYNASKLTAQLQQSYNDKIGFAV